MCRAREHRSQGIEDGSSCKGKLILIKIRLPFPAEGVAYVDPDLGWFRVKLVGKGRNLKPVSREKQPGDDIWVP